MSGFSIIAAMDEAQGIGVENKMPWRLKKEWEHFAETTMGGTVIMGRRTWESLPKSSKPLKGRLNIVLSRSGDIELPEGAQLAHSLDEALEQAVGDAFVIGGEHLFKEAIQRPDCEQLILTEVYSSFDCDAFFPEIPSAFKIRHASEEFEENDIRFRVFTYERA